MYYFFVRMNLAKNNTSFKRRGPKLRLWKEKVFLEERNRDFFFSKNRALFSSPGRREALRAASSLSSRGRDLGGWLVALSPALRGALASRCPCRQAARRVLCGPGLTVLLLICSKGKPCREGLCGCCPGHSRYRGRVARSAMAARLPAPSCLSEVLEGLGGRPQAPILIGSSACGALTGSARLPLSPTPSPPPPRDALLQGL